MRLVFLLLALVAAATAVPQLKIKAGNVDVMKKQRDMIILLDHMLEDIRDPELRKIGYEYNIRENLHNYRDQGVVKYLIYATRLGYMQRKGSAFTASMSILRKQISALTKTFLGATDYNTFIKTAAWARCYLNEAQFVKAFVTAVLTRTDTKDIVVLPPTYEVFPHYFFDARVIRKAQNLRAKCFEKTGIKDVIEIPVDHFAWLPKGENSIAYFTQDIGLNNYYSLFHLARWMLPHVTHGTDDTVTQNFDCDRCEIGRGSQYYYVHQQLLARYNMERLSNKLMPIKEVDFTNLRTPFKSHLTYLNGLEFPGRGMEVDLVLEKERLVKDVWKMERRLTDMIEKNAITTIQGTFMPLYDRKGLDILGNLIESTGRSMNPRYYGSLDAAARELLGGAVYSRFFLEPTPSVLEVGSTAARDPVFYKLFKRILSLFKRYQDSLPMYKEDDLMLPGVTIEDVKFDKLVTYCDKFKVDIDSATILGCDRDKKHVELKAVVDRLNHKPYNFEVIVQSDKFVKGAVVRVYIGPKYDIDGRYINIKDNRLDFVELDQFLWDIKVGKTVIRRKSIDAPMRSLDATTKKDLLRKIDDAMNSHQPFYAEKISQISGFPERLALPKGRYEGFPIQMVVIISSPKAKTLTYNPVVPMRHQTFQNVDFDDFVGDYKKEIYHTTRFVTDDIKDRNVDTMNSGETFNMYKKHGDFEKYGTHFDRQFARFGRSIEDKDFEMTRDKDTTTDFRDTLDTDTRTIYTDDTLLGKTDYLNDYYKDKHVFEMIGGSISLDGRPLGYPFDRPMNEGCLWVPNIKVVDLNVFYEGKECRF